MATIPTSIGPIGARQINRNLYVGQSDFKTIQNAVSYAARAGALFVVVIPFDYAGSDAISAVTGGSANIQILDQRQGQMQVYVWSGSQFVAGKFQQANGFVSMGKPSAIPSDSAAFYYDPAGTAGTGTAHIDITANPSMGMPSFNLTAIPSDGTSQVTFFRCQISVAGGAVPAGIPQIEAPSQLALFNGPYTFDGYNLWTGEVYLPGGKGMSVWARADEDAIDLQGETIGGAYDQTIRLNYLGGNVKIGPVTFDADGNIIGIDGIEAATIETSNLSADYASFQTCEVDNSPVRTFANTPGGGGGDGMVWPVEGIAVSLGDHWQDPSIDPASLATWPATGIPVSTGAAWGTSIAAASLATWPATGIPVSTGAAWGTSIAVADVARLGAANTFTAAGTNLNIVNPSTNSLAPLVINQPNMAIGTNTGIWIGQSNTSTHYVNYGFVLYAGGTSNGLIGFVGGPQTIFNYTGDWLFPGGITANGGFYTSGSKAFRISHPLDDTKTLTHASLEGPENAVFYRGEGATNGGWKEINLPDYFEALTMQENRSVLLTPLFDNEDEPISTLAASRVKDGKFKVWSGLPKQKFYWEVKAVRLDIEPLVVTADKEPTHDATPSPGTDRSGETEA